jgi:hypothetical protein
MVKDLSGEKEAQKQAIVEALKSLRGNGCDINPYSVSNESGVPRQLIARTPEFMKLLNDARSGVSNNGTAQKQEAAPAQAKPAKPEGKPSEERVQELEAYNMTLRQRIQQMQAELIKLKQEAKAPHPVDASLHEELYNLRDENAALREQLSKLKDEVQSAAKSVNIAWQQGYLAGQHAATEELQQQKTFIESLAEAATAATAYGDNNEVKASTATAVADVPEPAMAEPEAYIAPEISINDPEVLNDPFTAKLLNALGGEIVEEPVYEDSAYVNAPEYQPEPQPIYSDPPPEESNPIPVYGTINQFADVPDGIQPSDPAQTYQAIETLQSHHAQHAEQAYEPTPEPAPETAFAEPPVQPNFEIHTPEPPADEEDDEQTKFSAEELHTLFRNKYVNPEADPVEARDPAKSGTFPSVKKFVGTNKSASEPLPTAPRVFPPEIRKACRLLGLNPEDMTRAVVTDAWKKEMAKPGVHPDTGGDTEMAIYLNTAKDTLMRWIDDQTPKLGKKFGGGSTRDQPKPRQNKHE